MKYIGIFILNAATVLLGISSALKLKRKCIISGELIEMAELMAVELSYSASNSQRLVNRLRSEKSLSHLSFLNDIDFESISISTSLSGSDNERVNLLFKNLGSTDIASMLELINAFKAGMNSSRAVYEAEYKNKSRLYIAFGVLGGLAASIVLV